MIYTQIDEPEFMELVNKAEFQNQDILEAWEFGYKDIPDAYIKAQHAWCRYWVISHEDKVLTLILEARDGTLTFFTTTNLPGNNIRRYVKILKKLVIKVTKCREVVFVKVATWHKPAIALLRTVGFKQYIIHNHNSIWVYEYGKQN